MRDLDGGRWGGWPLRTRVEGLEQAVPRATLHDRPDGVLERRLDLLLHLYVHEPAGTPTEGLRQELAATGIDPMIANLETRSLDQAEIHREVILVLQAESHQRAGYKRFLALLGELEGHAESPLTHPRQ